MGSRVRFTAALCASIATFSGSAVAAPPWVDRPLTLPAGDWAFDLGIGVGHVPRDPLPDSSGAGINAEMAVGVTSRVELGVRTGIRFGDPLGRSIRADEYGRLFDRQTFDAGEDVMANPELRVRGALVRARVVELALEGRVVLPLASPTSAGLLFGVPLAFHLGNRVRLDTGAYTPIIFGQGGTILGPRATGTYFAISLPLDVWIQATPRVWLGPMTGLLVEQPGDAESRTHLSFGFGFGYEITHYLDFRAIVRFPTLNDETRIFGIGAGVEIRIE